MRRSLTLLIPLLLASSPAMADDFLKDQAETRGWMLGVPTQVTITPDGATVIFLRSPPRSPVLALFAMDVATGKVRELVTPEQILKGGEEKLSPEERALRERKRVSTRGFTRYQMSRDGKLLLVELSGRAYVLPLAGGSAREVVGPDAQGKPSFDPRLSPDGRMVAFVRGDELWVTTVATGAAQQLTQGATETKIHGQAEFIAAEELGRHAGYWWSPDSRNLIYEEYDTTGVERFHAADPARPFDGGEPQVYPRAGTANVKIAFGLVAATGGATKWIEWDKARYEYVERVTWQPGAPPTMLLRSRDHKDVSLVAVDPKSGATRELVHVHDDAWVEESEHFDAWLADGSGFLWRTDQRGDWQLELRSPDGKLVREVTKPEWGAVRGIHLDDAHRSVFVARTVDVIDQQIWRVPLDGGAPIAITNGPDNLTASFAEESAVQVVTTMPAQGQPRTEVFRADGKSAGELPSVAAKPPFPTRLEVVKLDGLWTSIVRPQAFDPRKKYPVILDVYGGPSLPSPRRAGLPSISNQWLADRGYIVVEADNRGTQRGGRVWSRAIKDAFVTVPLEDQVKALTALGKHEPAMDLTRVGVVGHSFGGYMAALAVMRRPDLFKAAVAGAPVVDWRNYDTGYTERYLGVPPPAGKSDAYEKNGLLPYVKDLQRPILLIHGTADDNVHFSESLLLYSAAFRAGRSQWIDLLPMVGHTHMFVEPELKIRYWERVLAFYEQHLK